jgi:hypothetical protein
LAEHFPKKSEEICDSNQEKSLDTENEQPNKTMSESEITLASQAVNLDILLELAESDDDDDDDDESLKTPRKSSTDHDDDNDNVFPSSGFCLPIGPNNQKNEVNVLNFTTSNIATNIHTATCSAYTFCSSFQQSAYIVTCCLTHFLLQENQSVPSSLSVFLQDMSKMVGNASLSDVMIVTKGNENIPAHSFMLGMRSEVLADVSIKTWITCSDVLKFVCSTCFELIVS